MGLFTFIVNIILQKNKNDINLKLLLLFEMPNITARDIPTILGMNPYETPWMLLEKKVEDKHRFFGNKFTEHGRKYENTALSLYTSHTGNDLFTIGNSKHPKFPWITGRPDAITKNNCLVEAKCPFSARKKTLNQEDIPPHYWAQCQVYMEMCNIEICHYAELSIPPGSPTDINIDTADFRCFPIVRDRQWWNDIIPIVEKFYQHMSTWYKKGSLREHTVRKAENIWDRTFIKDSEYSDEEVVDKEVVDKEDDSDNSIVSVH